MRSFARLRFESTEVLTGSALEVNDPVRDTAWLTALVKVRNFFASDPVSLAIIYNYFPNLANLFLAGLAATADYGHDQENDKLNNPAFVIDEMFKAFGTDKDGNAAFKPAFADRNLLTAQKIEKAIQDIGMPANVPPATPDVFHLRVGAANFYVPPVSISVSTGFKTGSLTGGAIRQKASPKFNSGYRETTINVRLYFPNYEEIWGISIDDATKVTVNSDFKIDFKEAENEGKIDKFLSSLRGLVAAFKYSPILPIKNYYLNSVHGISGVALNSMNISTIPDYPFALVVDLEMLTFNHKPFLPMIKDFNQAVHWGKYRHYMGRAAGSMYNYINEEFILDSGEALEALQKKYNPHAPLGNSIANAMNNDETNNNSENSELGMPFVDGVLTTNVYKDWEDGRNITLYVPAKIQSKIYAPDESTFRTPEEAALTDVGRGFWEGILNFVGIDVNESANYHRSLDSVVNTSTSGYIPLTDKKKIQKVLDVALAGAGEKDIRRKVYDSLIIEYIAKNNITNNDIKNYLKDFNKNSEVPAAVGSEEEAFKLRKDKSAIYDGCTNAKGALQFAITQETNAIAKKRSIDFDPDNPEASSEWVKIRDKEVEPRFVEAFNVSLYERFYTNSDIISLLQAAKDKAGSFSFREWDVPMLQVDLNPSSVIVNSVNVAIGNNLAKLQLQMQDEPTFQFIGSKDSYVNVSMTVFGEKELIKIKKTFDFLSGLARLEHAAGVIGFMGIKNIITALCGIKYVMPLQYNVDTIPNFPHVYNVQLSLVDFDVYQQKREQLSTEQQRKFIEDFKNKRNPFLRLKQNWSIFNGYPDLPLNVKDKDGNVVGTLDPDYYFRSFSMIDDDVVNNIIDPENFSFGSKNITDSTELDTRSKELAEQVKSKIVENNATIEEIKEFLIDQQQLSASKAMNIFRAAIFDRNNDLASEQEVLGQYGSVANKYPEIWKDFVDYFIDEFGVNYTFADLKFDTRYGSIQVGELLSGSKEQVQKFNDLLNESEFNLQEGKFPSFDPDDVDFFSITHYIPSADSRNLGKIPAILQTPDGGYVFGYSDENDGRFYIAPDSLNITKEEDGKISFSGVKTTSVTDTSSPDRSKQDVHSGVLGATSIDGYNKPYSSGRAFEEKTNINQDGNPTSSSDSSSSESSSKIESVSSNGSYKSVAKHWEKMMLDSQYRDISGRMLRVFPTYMLWLIDEGGFFAGQKLFDNFYGLQSIIDFSIVQSEDILGDTLMLRLSNTYSKLTKPELTLTEIVNTTGGYNQDTMVLAPNAAPLVDVLLNASRNLQSHFSSKYVTEIEHIRLKPGVRVHLRGGYGANPNALQTLFNGVITNVEYGEIVTVTAQSDAIELSPIINSTNKKGDSGKIDGGINTGLWMSEPRDLMIRLLSMGTSRTREAFALATRGTVFSENKFGIRHFGSILYEPLTENERVKAQQYTEAVNNACVQVGNNPITGTAGQVGGATVNLLTGGLIGGGFDRTPIWGAIGTLWSNFSTQRDLEIFKRNIYPGNGLGIAQFMGGDIDDGWGNIVSADEQVLNEQVNGYLDRLTDVSWSGIINQANQTSGSDASNVLDSLTEGNKLIDSSHASGTSQILGGIALGAVAAGVGAGPLFAVEAIGRLAGKFDKGTTMGSGLLKSLSGRGATNIFKTLGLVSDLDDDIYDEVSFRAQTYMRSVWDMFQLCARLLPNYIVAVRPFEDRSTIFYGKPHWLYTSGVVPVSTGYINDELANESGMTIPQWLTDDDTLRKAMKDINSQTSPAADSAAFATNTESSVSSSLAKMGKDAIEFTGIYAPGRYLNGQIINFADKQRNKYYDRKPDPSFYGEVEIRSRLPVNKGKVQVGLHLPYADPKAAISPNEIAAPVQNQHKQLDQLPLRYRYPYFTNRASGTLPSLDFDKILKINTSGSTEVAYEDLKNKSITFTNLALFEKEQIQGKDSDETKLISKDQNGDTKINMNFNFANLLAFNMGLEEQLSSHGIFDPSGINPEYASENKIESFKFGEGSHIVQMPIPYISSLFNDIEKTNEGKYEFTGGLKDIYQDPDFAYNRQVGYEEFYFDFREWGMPESPEAEQFYIAMRWPYNPMLSFDRDKIDSEEKKKEVLKNFIKDYGFNTLESLSEGGDDLLVGTPEDYKKRKVLVYNPKTQSAVVCQPAYFLWGATDPDGDGRIEAIVSPDAALFLGLLINEKGEIVSPFENFNKDQFVASNWDFGLAEGKLQECVFTFVEDSVPVGVVTSNYNLAQEFVTDTGKLNFNVQNSVGFGRFTLDKEYIKDKGDAFDISKALKIELGEQTIVYSSQKTPFEETRDTIKTTGLRADTYSPAPYLRMYSREELANISASGGNYIDYFKYVKEADYNELKEGSLYDKRNEESDNDGYASVYDPLDAISITARGFYDEDFDRDVKVIAGNGRTLKQGQDIWDQFRWGYHTYESVKDIFQTLYGMDPDSEEENNPFIQLITNKNKTPLNEFHGSDNYYKEFTSILGADWLENNASSSDKPAGQALDKAVEEYINKGFDGFDENSKIISNDEKGIIDIFNKAIETRLAFISDIIKNNVSLLSAAENIDPNSQEARTLTEAQLAKEYLDTIKTPKQLFLLLVGLFRQKLWSDPYNRAWLVLVPDRKRLVLGGDKDTDAWSFRPVDKIWQAFIDYNGTYAKDASKFKQLLVNNAKEGSSSTNWVSGSWEDAKGFWDKNIGPIFTAFSSAFGNLLNMFRMSMAQMGYGLSEASNMSKQANILNKAYNDSIYYSLGRPGTLLRAVDNPFTREYAEPVVEVREPFQRIHYISSFTHILANGIQENLSGVATQITAVSDGQYPVTVALDKAAPPERQVEKTIETGIYFDNIRGSGFFGILHPVFHPMQTIRGISKAASGEPDELTARRIGLAHLKESIKDIYQGELTVIGNADIRPFDLVYLADVYERMYGIFEVEQVVHHFTPEMGFVTSITPNAFVTVNDPARWFMSSWISSHFSMQNLRNDSRLLMTGASNHNLINANGSVSVDSLAESLTPQMLGGIMYTHGHSALMKDVVANMAADAIPDVADQVKAKIKATTGKQDGSGTAAAAIAIGGPILTAAATALGAAVAGPAGAGIGFAAGAIGTDLAWSGWKWTRDNILDQHGCYVQYLNRNGQPMDAGLSFNQGMVVGRYHSKKLLPGILGVRTKVRTPEGNSYIRSDDLFKALGWKEREINDLVRHISLENAIVNSELLKYSGIGPEKTGLNQLFKVIGVVTKVRDGDTFIVTDIISGQENLVIRFEGINTSELYSAGLNGVINASIEEINSASSWETDALTSESQSLFNPSSPGGKALKFTADAVIGKLVVLRIAPAPQVSSLLFEDADYEAGSSKNRPENYSVAYKGEAYQDSGDDRYMASIFYKTDSEVYSNTISRVRSIFIKSINKGLSGVALTDDIINEFRSTLYPGSVVYKYFTKIYESIQSLPNLVNHFESQGESDPLNGLNDTDKKVFSILVSIAIVFVIYNKASQWPLATWDEYYNDGTPITLNWELVINGLAKVYTKGLIYNESPAIETAQNSIPTLDQVIP